MARTSDNPGHSFTMGRHQVDNVIRSFTAPQNGNTTDGAVFVDSGSFASVVAKINNWRSGFLVALDVDRNRSGRETGSNNELGASNGPLSWRRSNSLPL